MIETTFENVFEPAVDGTIRISDDAPEVLTEALQDAKSGLDERSEFVIRNVGTSRRSIEFGIEELQPVQTNSGTIFIGKVEGGTKVLAVALSREGPLSEKQVKKALEKIAGDANLTATEKIETLSAVNSLRSMKQARYFVIYNSHQLRDRMASVEVLLDNPNENFDELDTTLNDVETILHNFLSSIYTFKETVEKCLSNMNMLRKSKIYIQRYEDKIAVAIGLRHYVQHRSALRVQWLARYSHQSGYFEYKIGIPLHEVNDSKYYQGEQKDSSGKKYKPINYYYAGVDGYLINLEHLSKTVENETEEAYNSLKNHLQNEGVEGSELIEKFFRIKQRGYGSDYNASGV